MLEVVADEKEATHAPLINKQNTAGDVHIFYYPWYANIETDGAYQLKKKKQYHLSWPFFFFFFFFIFILIRLFFFFCFLHTSQI